MSQILEIKISFKGHLVQSIIIEGWPEEMLVPRASVIDNERAAGDSSAAAEANASFRQTMNQSLPKVFRRLKALGVEYVRVGYDGGVGDGYLDLFIPPKSAGRAPYFIPSDMADQIKTFFSALLRTRHPECFSALGSSGAFHWLIGPDVLVHRHTVQGAMRTVEYHGL